MLEASATAASPIRSRSSRTERGARALLDQLLMAPLHRAVALAEVDHASEAIAHHLDLDVARMLEILLDVHRAIAERGERLVLGQAEELGELLGIVRDPHPLAAAARRRLDDHRKPDALGELERLVGILDRPRRAGHRRHAGLLGQAPRGGLVAHLADLVAGGPDEGDVGGLADVGELGVLGQKAVAGMDRVGTGDLGGGDEIRDLEVGGAAGRRPDAHVVVGEAHVQRLAVGLAVDRHRRDAELPARANHPQGDLPAVGDQHLLEHQGVRSSAPEAPTVPRSRRTCGRRRSRRRRPAARTRSDWSSRRARSRRRSSRP